MPRDVMTQAPIPLALFRSGDGNRPFAQLWPGNEVRGIVGENRLRCVCFSFELSFFFCF